MSVSRRSFLLGSAAALAAAPLRMVPAVDLTLVNGKLAVWEGVRFVEECVTYPAGGSFAARMVSFVEIDGDDHYFVVSHPNPWRDLQREMTA